MAEIRNGPPKSGINERDDVSLLRIKNNNKILQNIVSSREDTVESEYNSTLFIGGALLILGLALAAVLVIATSGAISGLVIAANTKLFLAGASIILGSGGIGALYKGAQDKNRENDNIDSFKDWKHNYVELQQKRELDYNKTKIGKEKHQIFEDEKQKYINHVANSIAGEDKELADELSLNIATVLLPKLSALEEKYNSEYNFVKAVKEAGLEKSVSDMVNRILSKDNRDTEPALKREDIEENKKGERDDQIAS